MRFFGLLGRSPELPPALEEAVKDDQHIGELEAMIHAHAPLYALNGNPGWVAFQMRLDAMDHALTQQLKKAKPEAVPLIQAQLALLDDVLNLVPKALEESKQAREELDGMQ